MIWTELRLSLRLHSAATVGGAEWCIVGAPEPRHIHNARPGGQGGQGGQADEGSVGAIARGWFVCTEAGLRTRGDMARAVAAPVHADLVEMVGLVGFSGSQQRPGSSGIWYCKQVLAIRRAQHVSHKRG